MSILGIIHTIIAIIALLFAAVTLFKNGVINPYSQLGKYYSILTVIACITSFGLSKAGGFNEGHILGILILVLLAVAYSLGRITFQQRNRVFIQVFCMSVTLFLSLIPAVNETLSRLPVDHPLANGPESPLVQSIIKGLLVLLIIGLIGQFLKIKKLSAQYQRS
jgi:hypothetical protein